MTLQIVLLASAAVVLARAEDGWWMTEPVRWVQTNLREVDASLDAKRLVTQFADMRANVVLMGMGGIAAYYPTKTPYHYPQSVPSSGSRHVRRRCTRSSCARHSCGRPVRLQQNPRGRIRCPSRVVLPEGER